MTEKTDTIFNTPWGFEEFFFLGVFLLAALTLFLYFRAYSSRDGRKKGDK